jgi:hypothetical protein
MGLACNHAHDVWVGCVDRLPFDTGAEMKSVYTEKLEAEYKFLREELNDTINRFESMKKEHHKTVEKILEDINSKFFELQKSRMEDKKDEQR